MRTSDLTNGQRLNLDRRRRGETQVSAAKGHGVTLGEYRLCESDQKDSLTVTKLGKMTMPEQCYFARKMAGLSVTQLSKKMKICRWWICQMEKGIAPIERLKTHWAL